MLGGMGHSYIMGKHKKQHSEIKHATTTQSGVLLGTQHTKEKAYVTHKSVHELAQQSY